MCIPKELKFACLSILLIATPLIAEKTEIWVTNYEGSSISIIDAATDKVVRTIGGIPNPYGVAFSPDGKIAYVSSETTEDDMFLVDTKTGKIINKVLLSGRPNLQAVTPDGSVIAACIRKVGAPKPIGSGPVHNYHFDDRARTSTEGGQIDFIDAATLVMTVVPTKAPMHDCFSTPDGKYIVAGSTEGKFLDVFDAKTRALAWEVPFDRGVLTMDFETNPDGSTRRIFLCLDKWRGFAVVDFAQHREVERIRFPDPVPELPSQDPDFQPNDPHATKISPDRKTLWVGIMGSNQVFAYSLPDLKLLGYAVPVPPPYSGGVPAWFAFTPDGKKLFVGLQNAPAVSVIDPQTMKAVDRITVGADAKRVYALVRR